MTDMDRRKEGKVDGEETGQNMKIVLKEYKLCLILLALTNPRKQLKI
jgi:hypothetical protein